MFLEEENLLEMNTYGLQAVTYIFKYAFEFYLQEGREVSLCMYVCLQDV